MMTKGIICSFFKTPGKTKDFCVVNNQYNRRKKRWFSKRHCCLLCVSKLRQCNFPISTLKQCELFADATDAEAAKKADRYVFCCTGTVAKYCSYRTDVCNRREQG